MTLVDARRRAHLTAGEAAAKLGVHRNTLSRWEHGLRTPDGIALRRIQALYRLSDMEMISLLHSLPSSTARRANAGAGPEVGDGEEGA